MRESSASQTLAATLLCHPIEVAKLCWTWGCGTTVMVQAALLHDTLEDTDITESEILNECGDRVLSIVKELTFSPPSGISPVEQAKLKEEHLEGFATASIESLIIKVADRLCNVIDFWLTNPGYALKYFNKAAPLFQHMFFRHDEIARVFGEEAEANIIRAYNNVKRCVENEANVGRISGVSSWL